MLSNYEKGKRDAFIEIAKLIQDSNYNLITITEIVILIATNILELNSKESSV